VHWKYDCLQPPAVQNCEQLKIHISYASESFDMWVLFSIWNETVYLLFVDCTVEMWYVFVVLRKSLLCIAYFLA
jgi:hypothetical protein